MSSSWQVLDLCAGCGIVGLDFLFHCLQNKLHPAVFDFMEVQDVYRGHFDKNVSALTEASRAGDAKLNCHVQFILQNYDILQTEEFSNRYDLILCNPPYFQPHQGTLSPSEFKNRCRFFIDSDLPSLLRGLENSLKPQGKAFVLLRSLKDHGEDIISQASQILQRCSLERAFQVRGTDVGLIIKHN